MTSDEKTLQHDLDLARADVHRAEAHLALGRLASIQMQIDDLRGTSLWAEHELTYAGALAAMMDPGAHTAFEEALIRISELEEANPALEMRAHEEFGKYLIGKRAFTAARKHYQAAEKVAEELDQVEDVAHFQMCIIRIDLEQDHNPQFVALQKLKEAAKDGYTWQEQREAWIHYTEQFREAGRQLVAARKGTEATVDYFRGVLSEIRRNRK